jgi:hypothetical protein
MAVEGRQAFSHAAPTAGYLFLSIAPGLAGCAPTVFCPIDIPPAGALQPVLRRTHEQASPATGSVAVETPCANVGATGFIFAAGMTLGSTQTGRVRIGGASTGAGTSLRGAQ